MSNVRCSSDIKFNLKTALKGSIYWLLVNGLGMCAYLFFEALILAPRSEPDMGPPGAEMFALVSIMFFYIMFIVVNVIWLISIIKRACSNGNWRSSMVWLLVCLAWGVTLAVPLFGYSIAIGILKILTAMVNGTAWK